MKLRTKILLSVLFAVLCWLAWMETVEYSYPEAKEIGKRLNYLQRVIDQPLSPGSDIMLLRGESFEFILFTYAYSTYALTNLAVKDSTYRDVAARLIRKSISDVLSETVARPYGIEQPVNLPDSLPHYSVLYMGHLNLMMGCYRLISNDTAFNRLNDKISASLAGRYRSVGFMNLESYPSAIWIPDNTVAIASLGLHSMNAGSGYDSVCRQWVQYAREHYIEQETNTLYSTIDSHTGAPKEEPRGSMLGWSMMFIYQFDPGFAVDLYQDYKKHFSSNYFVFRLFRERYDNTETSIGDIDSGPVFRGYSIPANEFALPNAVLAGDYRTARKIERLIRFGAKEITRDHELKYKVRFVDMNISPMAEAIVLYSLTMVRWTR